jgi:hypothetical protein
MKTAIKAWTLRVTSLLVSIFVASFSVGAGAVIFTRSVEIVNTLSLTKAESSGILVAIGLSLIWIIILGADSAEHILKSGFRKADNISFRGEKTNE